MTLELLLDDEGTVDLGWVASGVVFARFNKRLSADLGQRFATRLTSYVNEAPQLHYFADASLLSSYDLIARSALLRVFMEHRRKFVTLVTLTWSEGISEAARTLRDVIGEPFDLVTDKSEFEGRMLKAAPELGRRALRQSLRPTRARV